MFDESLLVRISAAWCGEVILGQYGSQPATQVSRVRLVHSHQHVRGVVHAVAGHRAAWGGGHKGVTWGQIKVTQVRGHTGSVRSHTVIGWKLGMSQICQVS